MKEKKNQDKVIYYSDEKHDDFAKKIDVKTDLNNFKYIHKCYFYRFCAFLLRFLIVKPILALIAFFVVTPSFKNRKVLKDVRNKGYYLYSNHTGYFDIFDSCMIGYFRHPVFIASWETFNIKGIKHLVSLLGAIPVPKSDEMYKKYTECMSWHIKNKHKIIIYPEAHIWPYYTGIRNYSSGSFRYPVNDNAPVIVATTTYRKRLLFKKPKAIIYLDGPFFPNNDLPYEQRVDELRNHVHDSMVQRSSIKDNYSYYKYIKKE